jgi:hypothetical protein
MLDMVKLPPAEFKAALHLLIDNPKGIMWCIKEASSSFIRNKNTLNNNEE